MKLLRTIRQKLIMKNQNVNYYKYAVGEIILVVLGILIALSINNWNENRKNKKKELVLINNIIEDLGLDLIHINKSLNEVVNQKELANIIKLSGCMDNQTSSDISTYTKSYGAMTHTFLKILKNCSYLSGTKV